ncbi:MAG TPA: response regulator [Polyangiaceae bacterium]|nr:response regulator [Polyangiaceae bacterium]
MAKGRILIIEQDEWESTLLAKFLGEAGYEVHQAGEARAGFDLVRALQPECILCDVALPDIDGFWVARRVRTEPSPVATAPFLFLTNAEDTESRLQGLNVGADIYLTRPFRAEEVVAQVGALIEMANRLRKQRQSFTSDGPSSAPGAAFTGDIAQMSVATVLTLLELERRSGYLKLRSEVGKVAVLQLDLGTLAGATLDDRPAEPTPLLRETLRWKKGSFSFRNAEVSILSGSRQAIGGLLIEAMRLEDEARR